MGFSRTDIPPPLPPCNAIALSYDTTLDKRMTGQKYSRVLLRTLPTYVSIEDQASCHWFHQLSRKFEDCKDIRSAPINAICDILEDRSKFDTQHIFIDIQDTHDVHLPHRLLPVDELFYTVAKKFTDSNTAYRVKTYVFKETVGLLASASYSDADIVTFDSLQPLSHFLYITRVDIDTQRFISLGDEDLMSIAVCWPSLQILKLNSSYGWGSPDHYHPSLARRPTLTGIIRLLFACSDLRQLHISIDGTSISDAIRVFQPCVPIPEHRLRTIDLLDSTSGDARDIKQAAILLSRILKQADISAWTNDAFTTGLRDAHASWWHRVIESIQRSKGGANEESRSVFSTFQRACKAVGYNRSRR
ncbi:hypothetical protein CONPUDRAFT_70421 [Coniophora puteana RWD-64-598 SS2]|uniref:Uncharacterized protein n=1 Tax=Coniophora puteana (strain RWD-64-598) TaxID=741705 RepID=A0A5M3N433_CONPW|nr:uncharacterized protein CONPUDRAFT_70421 [Coniophora puteana RWD-64-598 SS2]EIW85671.1 hypothetical protein CONPUDRAFT_70421 [Coniophora puteana RWD-64-598 SS2]